MSLFTKKLSEAELEKRIEELELTEQNLKTELQGVQKLHAQNLAVGDSTAATKKRITELTIDLDSLPVSISLVSEELRQIQLENKSAVVKKFLASVPKKSASIGSKLDEMADILKRAAVLNSEINAERDNLNNEAVSLEILDRARYREEFNPFIRIAGALKGFANYGGIENTLEHILDEVLSMSNDEGRIVERFANNEIARLEGEI